MSSLVKLVTFWHEGLNRMPVDSLAFVLQDFHLIWLELSKTSSTLLSPRGQCVHVRVWYMYMVKFSERCNLVCPLTRQRILMVADLCHFVISLFPGEGEKTKAKKLKFASFRLSASPRNNERRKFASFRLRLEITKSRTFASFRLRHEITKRRKFALFDFATK